MILVCMMCTKSFLNLNTQHAHSRIAEGCKVHNEAIFERKAIVARREPESSREALWPVPGLYTGTMIAAPLALVISLTKARGYRPLA